MTTKKPQLVEIVPTETGWQRREWHSLSVTHLPSDYPKDTTRVRVTMGDTSIEGEMPSEIAAELLIADQEQKWGEERLPTND